MVTFLGGTAVLFFLVQLFASSALFHHSAFAPPRLHRFELPLASGALDFSTTERTFARKHQWLLFPAWHSEKGVGVRLLEQPALFKELFPGYGDELRLDTTLWRSYFSRPFVSSIFVPSLDARHDSQLRYSWLGCLDIVQRYGADTMVLGDSRTFVALPPHELSLGLGRSAGRLLQCGRSSVGPRVLTAFATELSSIMQAKQVGRLSSLVLGYSLSWANRTAGNLVSENEQLTEVKQFAESREKSVFRWTGTEALSPPTWDRLFPITYRDLKENQSANASDIREVPPGHYVPLSGSKRFVFNTRDMASLGALVEKWSLTVKTRASACDQMEAVARQYQDLLAASLQVAERVFVFFTPSIPLVPKYPPCVSDFLKQMLAASANSRVRVKLTDWNEYGLTLADHVHDLGSPGIRLFDAAHVNFAAARKLSSTIGAWVRQELAAKP